ncbi:MAG: hypothetical protein L0Z46_00160 [Nitrospiraceae bacterium]|nr:hypothetical protein [Nitrospiraceae bacterium]
MALNLEQFVRTRPFLYHLTDAQNVRRITTTGILESAAALLNAAGRTELMQVRRTQHLLLPLNGMAVSLRDQRPLYPGPMELQGGWTYGRFIGHVNSMVFFWPGTDDGPNGYGRRHFERYRQENPAILRIATADILDANANRPLFSRYNSGAPRCSNGVHAPRGPDTFVTAARFDATPSKVVEVVYQDEVTLPESTVFRRLESDRWQSLRARA